MSVIGAIVGVVVLAVGIGMMTLAPPLPPFFSFFFVLWIVIGVCVVGYHLVNALSGRAPATSIIEAQDEPDQPRPVAERLRELEELRQRKLVSESEYDAKRNEILKEV